ncbi:MAG: ArnT family glycosyltransferase [Kiritimatiellia bacterium]
MKKGSVFWLLGILAVGAVLRLWRFGAIAPTNSDEASYLRHARFMAILARKAVGVPVPVIAPERSGIWKYVRKEDWSEKPCWLHSAFMAVPMTFLGANDAAGALINLLFGLAVPLLAWSLTRDLLADANQDKGTQWISELSALAAAGLLAVCFYWLLYSRGFWAEADGAFFVLLSFYVLRKAFRPERRSFTLLLCAGAIAALAVLCHYRLLFVVGPLTLLAVIWSGKHGRWKLVLVVLVGFAGVILIAAGMLRLAAIFASGGIPFTGLIGALRERYFPRAGGVEQKGFQPGNLLAYGWYVVRNLGLCTSVLFLVGLLALLQTRGEERKNFLGVALFSLVPFVVLIFQIWVVARALVVAVPFACILASYGVATLCRTADRANPPRQFSLRVLVFVLLVGAAIENLAADLRLVRNEMGHKRVVEFLRREKLRHAFANPESAITYGWYGPELIFKPLYKLKNLSVRELAADCVAIFDAQKWHSYPQHRQWLSQLEERIAREAGPPACVVPNLTTAWPEFLMDGTQTHSLRGLRGSVEQARNSDIRAIRVYKLGGPTEQSNRESREGMQ